MWEKHSEAQRVGLRYGMRLRLIGALQGNIHQARFVEFEILTQQELNTLERIVQDAKHRAWSKYCEEKSKLPSKGNGK